MKIEQLNKKPTDADEDDAAEQDILNDEYDDSTMFSWLADMHDDENKEGYSKSAETVS